VFAQLLLGLALLIYLVFSITTIYFVFIGKKSANTTFVGKAIWYHGVVWIISMIAVVILTMAFIFANILLNVINLRVLIGG
jgi:hypothetical protein